MALRIRKDDGRIFCAAIHDEEDGDLYIDDGLHYEMSVTHSVIVTEPFENHIKRGEWWWINNVPEDVVIDGSFEDLQMKNREREIVFTPVARHNIALIDKIKKLNSIIANMKIEEK